ncbi:hypothetical protein BC834DRAFT_839332 [Gloeopeniophorella convolvens]|nr:hypothetical protein BC834DRAFT_839501 [Gloeopeniophorella convolvens]KAI0257752.1 hypothetical protein BC834DRAFT_839332 [Gloeopeniophorella convolvens]
MPEWQNALKYFSTRQYQQALAKLEGLVVARLFELHKMGLSGTGYKLRTHINKSLKTRCKAIQRALKKFNEAATALGRPSLEWKDISSYESLAEFELLRECRDDIRQQPWADSANRQALLYALKIERANEERERLNIEVARLVDWMKNEEALLMETITQLRNEQSSLIFEIEDWLARRLRQNQLHRSRILQIYQLRHFTGVKDVSLTVEPSTDLSVHEVVDHEPGTRPDLDASSHHNVLDSEKPDAEEDDQARDELDKVNEFLENVSNMGMEAGI